MRTKSLLEAVLDSAAYVHVLTGCFGRTCICDMHAQQEKYEHAGVTRGKGC